jgi:hypothetical protein
MANDVRNIIVGAADVYISVADTKATVPTLVAGTKAATTVAADAAYKGTGLTTGGVELTYAPNYGEVTVDQLLDAARLFKQSMQVMVRTTLSEGTLENMNFAFGQKASQLSVDSVNNQTTLEIGGGALGETPVERTVIFVGQAPYNFGKTGTASVAAGTKERVYIARRVVQMETVAHSLRRDGATEFPVNFRCLPDTDITDGSEYGKIIDRVYTA